MVETQEPNPVQVICDLRHFNRNIDSNRKMRELWQSIEHRLVGKRLTQGGKIEIPLGRERLVLWVVEARSLTEVTASTVFHIVDIFRNPALLYRCQVCKSYGPLRCVECVKSGRPEGEERLCSKCAYSIPDRWSVYCSDHLPHCRCYYSLCKDQATFFCQECRKPYGEHFRHEKGEYCEQCYNRLFGQCSTCEEQEKSGSLGKLRCTFKSHDMSYPCGKPLCWEHGLQWKIWGPHNRGITFCEQHKQLIRNTNPIDVLTMMITAQPPRQKRSFSLANAFRLRRLLNYERKEQLSFEQIRKALYTLKGHTDVWDRHAQKRYENIVQAVDTAVQEKIPQLQEELLKKVKEFYRDAVGTGAARTIVALEVTDRFLERGKPDRYSIDVYLSTSNKGPYIGRGGEISKRLQAQLNISSLDFWDDTGTVPRHLE